MKRESDSRFNILIGFYDDTKITDLLLHVLRGMHLPIFRIYIQTSIPWAQDVSGKDLQKFGLSITVATDLTKVESLDIALDLKTDRYYPHRKPYDVAVYIHRICNKTAVIKNLILGISRKLLNFHCMWSSSSRPSSITRRHYQEVKSLKSYHIW